MRGRGLAGFVLIALGLAFVVSGIAVLLLLAATAAVIGGTVMLVRRLTGRGRRMARPRDDQRSLELEPDFEIFPSARAERDGTTAEAPRLPSAGSRQP